VAISTAEAEYVSAGSCCAQLLWIKSTSKDYGLNFKNVPLLCDNESAIKMIQNPVQHGRTKHIDIRHHFIRDHQQKGDIAIESVGTDNQLADILTKPLDEKRFCKLRNEFCEDARPGVSASFWACTPIDSTSMCGHPLPNSPHSLTPVSHPRTQSLASSSLSRLVPHTLP
jgi:hypothetical protein